LATKKPPKKGAAHAAPHTAHDRQWEAVTFWARVLEVEKFKPPPTEEDEEHSLYDVRDDSDTRNLALERFYKLGEEARALLPPGIRAEMPKVGSSPLTALFVYVEMGFYPPPELLLGLMECFDLYMAAKGSLSLEEAFIGAPKRRAGNYAAQSASRMRELMWSMEIASRAARGEAGIAIAEDIVNRKGLSIDPESILRVARKHWTKSQPEE
jgi:hypothetical protein